MWKLVGVIAGADETYMRADDPRVLVQDGDAGGELLDGVDAAVDELIASEILTWDKLPEGDLTEFLLNGGTVPLPRAEDRDIVDIGREIIAGQEEFLMLLIGDRVIARKD